MEAVISAIEYHLPEKILSNRDLAAEFSEAEMARVGEHIGIYERRIAADDECASDLAVSAARKLFASGACRPEEIDFILLCTQTPDYFLPTTACLLQDRLGIPTSAGALDFNLGCSGFIYGLALIKGLIETGQARTALLITAETYSKFIHPQDKGVRTIFGDGASATLVRGTQKNGSPQPGSLGPFCFGTDGRGANNLIVAGGGMRGRCSTTASNNLYMNGSEIFRVTLQIVPKLVKELLERAGMRQDEVDLFVFHQANRYMLEHLRKKLQIPEDRYCFYLENFGNTGSSTIPIALKCAAKEGRVRAGQNIVAAGWGVGYSWGGAVLRGFDLA